MPAKGTAEMFRFETLIRLTARLLRERAFSAVPVRTLNRGSSACAARSGAGAAVFWEGLWACSFS